MSSEPKKARLPGIDVDGEQWEQFGELAMRLGTNRSALIRELIAAAVAGDNSQARAVAAIELEARRRQFEETIDELDRQRRVITDLEERVTAAYQGFERDHRNYYGDTDSSDADDSAAGTNVVDPAA